MTWSPKWTVTVSHSLPTVSSCRCSVSPLRPHAFVAFSSVAKKIDELQEILRKKDEDMKQMEERYKRYMEKARTVSRRRESPLVFGSSARAQALHDDSLSVVLLHCG